MSARIRRTIQFKADLIAIYVYLSQRNEAAADRRPPGGRRRPRRNQPVRGLRPVSNACMSSGSVAMLLQMIDTAGESIAPDLARYLLTFKFTPSQHAEYERLASLVQQKELSPEERERLEAFVELNHALMMLRATATHTLQKYGYAV